jgi:ABC-2 type transport system permease protein
MTGFAVQTGLFFRRKLLETLRQPVWIITGLTTPVLYLALFAPLLRSLAGGPAFPPGHVLDVFVPGIMVLIAFGAGMGAGWPIIWELDSGVIERLRVTPASDPICLSFRPSADEVAEHAAVSSARSTNSRMSPPQCTWYPKAAPTAITTAPGTANMTMSRSTVPRSSARRLAAVVTGAQLPLTLLAGILLPLSLGPTWLRVLGHVNPMYYAVQAARALAAGSVATGPVGLGFLVMALIAGLAVWWGTRAYQRAMV